MKTSDLIKLGAGAAAVGLLAYLAYRNRNLINPLSRENAAYSSVNAIGAQLVPEPDGAGKNADGSWSLGGWLFDKLNPATAEAVKKASQPVQVKSPAEPEMWQPYLYDINSGYAA